MTNEVFRKATDAKSRYTHSDVLEEDVRREDIKIYLSKAAVDRMTDLRIWRPS